ncbi:type I restriction endonuclease subunit R, partial [Cronobacter sakazakii]|nr:type I restriction endonuclease subunit R [Cronobacter sakazakii]
SMLSTPCTVEVTSHSEIFSRNPKAECELLDSVDLSSYGLQRVKLNHSIKLSDQEAELDPQNPNPRGAHGGEKETDRLDEIIRTFNEHWFQGWSATPEEQKIKFVNITENIRNHPDFESKYKNNPDPHNKGLAFDKILKEIMLQRRKDELELYKLFAGDFAFKTSLTQSIQRVIDI